MLLQAFVLARMRHPNLVNLYAVVLNPVRRLDSWWSTLFVFVCDFLSWRAKRHGRGLERGRIGLTFGLELWVMLNQGVSNWPVQTGRSTQHIPEFQTYTSGSPTMPPVEPGAFLSKCQNLLCKSRIARGLLNHTCVRSTSSCIGLAKELEVPCVDSGCDLTTGQLRHVTQL